MSKPFDVTFKHLGEGYPEDCMRLLRLDPAGPVDLINADLDTVTGEADKVIRVLEQEPWLAHVEFQASYDPGLPLRMLRYNVLLLARHGLPVQSAVILLRPEASGPAMTGKLEYQLPNGKRYLEFDYQMLRLWQVPVETILAGGIGTLPLAPLARVDPQELQGIIQQMDRRFNQKTTPAEAAVLWTSTYWLMGLRYSSGFTTHLLKGVRAMKESVTYQATLAEGEEKGIVKGIRKTLYLQGEKRFGLPKEEVSAQIEAISDQGRLEQLSQRMLEVNSWEELLQIPQRKPKGPRKKPS